MAADKNSNSMSPLSEQKYRETEQLHTDLYLFERNLEAERLVVVRVQRTLLDGRFLLANSLAVQNERQLNVRIYIHTTHCSRGALTSTLDLLAVGP